MFNKELANKIDIFIKDKFPLIYEYNFDGIVLLCSGAIRSLIMGAPVKDLDFIILTQNECQILDFIKKFKLKYSLSALGGYKIYFNNFCVDMFSVDDLLYAVRYNIDMMFYDIQKCCFINCGSIKAIENAEIVEINNREQPLFTEKKRIKKIVEFVKFVNKDKKKVKVKENKIFWEYKMFIKKVKIKINDLFKGSFRKCFIFLKDCKKEFFWVIAIGIMIALLSIIFPTIIGLIVSNLLIENYNFIKILITTLLFSRTLVLILQVIFNKLYLIINKRMVNNIRKTILDYVLNLEQYNFNNNNRGSFIEKLKSDPNEITRIFNAIKDLLIKEFGHFGLIIYVCFLDFRIGLLICFFSVIIFYVIMLGIRKRKQYLESYYSNQEKYSSVLGEMINGVDEIKKLDLKENYKKQTISSFMLVSENEFKGNYYQKNYTKIANFIEVVAVMFILILGLHLVKSDLLDVTSFIIIIMYNSIVFTFVNKLGLLLNLLSDLNISCNRIFSLLDGNKFNEESFGNIYNNKCKGIIKFDNVEFRYDCQHDYVLNDCSFSIQTNEYVSIVGKSGEGKTTILNLISRLYSVDDGVIKIDGIDIKEYSEKFIRDNISVISQSPYLFDMSIKDNLKLVKEDITDKEIKNVCKKVCLDEFIESLPNKYDTVIGEGGIKLSGGQKQRLGIARALIKNTKIILLDEVTSALDNETGTVIKKVINNIKKNHTIIVVTHELSMIKDADRILVLDNGKIVGDGKHNELLKNNKIYKKLYKIK